MHCKMYIHREIQSTVPKKRIKILKQKNQESVKQFFFPI